MSDLPPAEQLDFLLQQGNRFAILGSGQRVEPTGGLPADAGTHLVAGTARKGVRTFKTVPPGREWLDPLRRWLGMADHGDEPTVRLFDISNEMSPAFRFQSPGLKRRIAIHPQGDLIATREGDDLCLHGPDGHLVHSGRFPRSNKWWAGESFEFSVCGEFLWLVSTPPDGKAVLHLLRCPSLEVCDTCEPSWDRSGPHDRAGSWCEVTTALNPATGHLAIRRQAGDDFLTLHFYDVRKGRIRLHEPHLTATKDNIPGERVDTPVFAPDGRRFLLLDSDGHLHEFSFPECRPLALVQQFDLRKDREDYDTRFDTYGYADSLALITLGTEVIALRSGDLLPSRLPVDGHCDVLPNGLIVDRYENCTTVIDFRLTGRTFPAVAALDSKEARVTAVYRKVRSRWREVGDDVGWLETAFTLART